MDAAQVDGFFVSYLDDFVALGRGDTADPRRILDYWGAPLIMSSDAGCVVLREEEQILGALAQQVGDLRAAGYAGSHEIDPRTTVINAHCALHRGRMVRHRDDGTELARFDATYLVTDTPVGPRISSIAVHTAL